MSVHRALWRVSIHRDVGENPRDLAERGSRAGPVVVRVARHHGDVTTHRDPVDSCGQLRAHPVYESVFPLLTPLPAAVQGRYPQLCAPRWVSVWTVHVRVRVLARTVVVRLRAEIAPPPRVPCGRAREVRAMAAGGAAGCADGGVPGWCDTGCRARAAAIAPTRRRGCRAARWCDAVDGSAGRSAARGGGPRGERPGCGVGGGAHAWGRVQPRCCCLIRLVSSVTWL